jgi:hypothetical protein
LQTGIIFVETCPQTVLHFKPLFLAPTQTTPESTSPTEIDITPSDAVVTTPSGVIVSETDAATTKASTVTVTTEAASPYTGTGKTILCR